ncbi:hypothetical protein [Streptomyces sp. NPDC005732]
MTNLSGRDIDAALLLRHPDLIENLAALPAPMIEGVRKALKGR